MEIQIYDFEENGGMAVNPNRSCGHVHTCRFISQYTMLRLRISSFDPKALGTDEAKARRKNGGIGGKGMTQKATKMR